MSPYIRMFSMLPKLAPILNSRKNNFIVLKRTFFQILRKSSAEKLKELDNMPPEYNRIYKNTMDRYFLSIQVFSTLSVILICGLVLWSGQLNIEIDPQKLRSDHLDPFENDGLIYVIVFMILYMFLYLMLTGMPVRIYNYTRKQKYVFVFDGALLTIRKHVVCQANEVIKIENVVTETKDCVEAWRQTLISDHISVVELEAQKEHFIIDKIKSLHIKLDEQQNEFDNQEAIIQSMQALLIIQMVQYLDLQLDMILDHHETCNMMLNDLTSVLPTLPNGSRPTVYDCQTQIELWRQELNKTRDCFILFDRYCVEMMDCIYNYEFTNVLTAPKDIKLLTKHKDILHDNFLPAVTSLLL